MTAMLGIRRDRGGWNGDRNYHPLTPDYRVSVWPCGFSGPMTDAEAVRIMTEHAECGGCLAWSVAQAVHQP